MSISLEEKRQNFSKSGEECQLRWDLSWFLGRILGVVAVDFPIRLADAERDHRPTPEAFAVTSLDLGETGFCPTSGLMLDGKPCVIP